MLSLLSFFLQAIVFLSALSVAVLSQEKQRAPWFVVFVVVLSISCLLFLLNKVPVQGAVALIHCFMYHKHNMTLCEPQLLR